jgi:hypothetical protein
VLPTAYAVLNTSALRTIRGASRVGRPVPGSGPLRSLSASARPRTTMSVHLASVGPVRRSSDRAFRPSLPTSSGLRREPAAPGKSPFRNTVHLLPQTSTRSGRELPTEFNADPRSSLAAVSRPPSDPPCGFASGFPSAHLAMVRQGPAGYNSTIFVVLLSYSKK